MDKQKGNLQEEWYPGTLTSSDCTKWCPGNILCYLGTAILEQEGRSNFTYEYH